MTILLIFWVCASLALCVAFLSVAARQVPRMEETMAAGCEPARRPATPVALAKAQMAHPPLWSRPPSPPLQVQTEESIHLQLDDPFFSLPSIPAAQAGMGRACLSASAGGGKPQNHRLETKAPGAKTGAGPATQNVPHSHAVSSEKRAEPFEVVYDQV
jgi:hypothetical protein